MAQEINLGGTIYISSKRAAEITGYTQDYIGQLARGGQIIAQRVSGLWYVVEESLRNYKAKADEFKPEPPKFERQPDIESTVSFDGRDYVSAQRAAKITGYHQDYVGQLARSGKIVSRQVGTRWYVDREGIVEHKKHNDALLAAVQAESVGLSKPDEVVAEEQPQPEELHFKYIAPELPDPVPQIESRPHSFADSLDYMNENNDISAEVGEAVNEIPIRVIRPQTSEKAPNPQMLLDRSLQTYGPSRNILIVLGVIVAILGVGGGYWYISSSDRFSSFFAINLRQIGSVAAWMPDFFLNLVSEEMYYRRDSF